MELEFSGEMWFWRGPALALRDRADEEAAVLRSTAAEVSYGWGMIPAEVHIGATVWETALWPKDGRYIVPIKTTVRRAEELTVGDVITLRLSVACEAPLR